MSRESAIATVTRTVGQAAIAPNATVIVAATRGLPLVDIVTKQARAVTEWVQDTGLRSGAGLIQAASESFQVLSDVRDHVAVITFFDDDAQQRAKALAKNGDAPALKGRLVETIVELYDAAFFPDSDMSDVLQIGLVIVAGPTRRSVLRSNFITGMATRLFKGFAVHEPPAVKLDRAMFANARMAWDVRPTTFIKRHAQA